MCTCNCCSNEIEEDSDTYNTDDGIVCETCHDNEYGYCENCDSTVQINSIEEVETSDSYRSRTQYWCSSCVSNNASTCDCCSSTISNSAAITSDNTTLCYSCYSDNYFTCDNCGDIYHNDDYAEDGVCCNCHVPDSSVIMDYSTRVEDRLGFGKPEKFNGKSLWLGLELEVEAKGNRNDAAEKLIEDIDDTCILCHDSSLDDGFEIKVRPSNFADIKQTINNICDSNAVKYLRSHDTTTCGLHIHISREPLTQLQQSRINHFVNLPVNEALMTAICRRYDVNYAKIDHTAKLSDITRAWQRDYSNGKVISKTGSINDSRYAAVNFNYHTIELRLPKGTLKRETLLATIEFVQALLYFTQSGDYKLNTQYDFLRWLRDRPAKDKKEHYNNLINYLELKLDFFTFKQLELLSCA